MIKLKNKPYIISLLLVFIGTLFLLLPPTIKALAATSPSATPGEGLEISPPLIQLKANPGQSLNFQIFLRNITKNNLIAKTTVNDFVAQGVTGNPKILLDPNAVSPYSLKAWIENIPDQTLMPGQLVNINAKIDVPQSASPGGHYGLVRFTVIPAGLDTTGVALSASSGPLILLTVNGNIVESGKISDLYVSKNNKRGSFFEYGPLSFVELINNVGNVHFAPAGDVIVKNTFGKQIAALKVNDPPGNVLPNSTREFGQNLNKTNLFGRYTATMTLLYGSTNKVLNQTIVFWVIPYKLVATILLALIIVIIILRIAIKRYNRHVIRKVENQNQNPTNSPPPNQSQPPTQNPSQ